MILTHKLPGLVSARALEELLPRPLPTDEGVVAQVRTILSAVREEGDPAVLRYTEDLDGVALFAAGLKVSDEEFKEARKSVGRSFVEALRLARSHILAYHQEQRERSWFRSTDGMLLGEMVRPLESVGIYIPGGLAAYPSTVLMTVIPALVAGVSRVQLCTPPRRDGSVHPQTLVAAEEAGCKTVYRVGGIQAIGALAYGTATIPRVDKIVGPGNIYVTAAKKEVLGVVGIDGLAGPSEVAIVADDSADAAFVAADMLAQMEHGSGASAILVTPSQRLAERVVVELRRQVKGFPRLAEAAAMQSRLLVVENLDAAIETANRIAPEHLELMVAEPLGLLDKVRNAGTILLGGHTPVALTDYVAGPNHVLPTGGAARFMSPLGVRDFVKFSTVVLCEPQALARLTPAIEELAKGEGLEAHAVSAAIRKEGRR